MSAGSISGRLAAFAADLAYEALPDDVRRLASIVLLDTLGCALSGAVTEEAALVRKSVCDAAGEGGRSLVWGTSAQLPLPLAALVNGAASHAQELDDFGGCAHSGAVVIPAALGTAARVGASGPELISAIVVGYDVARRAMDGGGGYLAFKQRGWHSTSTCGVFGAAAAAGRLLGLDAQRLQAALGYAGSNAGGTWAFIPDGAMSKRLHPGFAAQTGVIAAYLAANGVTSPSEIFETPWGGFFPTYVGGKATPDKALEELGAEFRIRIVGIKPYAACRGTHSVIDAILELRDKDGLAPEKVRSIQIRGNATHVRQLGKQDIQTVLDAQFSLPYSIAAALVSGGAMLDQFTPEALHRADVLALARRVRVTHDPIVAEGEQPYVDVHLHDGMVLTRRVAIAKGDYRNPLGMEDVRAKFRLLAMPVIGEQKAARLEQLVMAAADLPDVQELVECLSVRPDVGGK